MSRSDFAVWAVLAPLIVRQSVQYFFILRNSKRPTLCAKETIRVRAEYLMILYSLIIGLCLLNFDKLDILRIGVGLIVVIAGSLLGIGAVWAIKNTITNEIRMLSGFSFCTSGAYSLSRHPMRNSTVLELAGVVVALSNSLLPAGALAVYLVLVFLRNREEDEFLTANVHLSGQKN